MVDPPSTPAVDDETASSTSSQQRPWVREFSILMNLSVPMMLSFLFSNAIAIVSLAFVGRLGADELGAAGLGVMFANVTGFSVSSGLLTASDTLCSQAYGAGNKKRVGIILQRSLVILVCSSLFISFSVPFLPLSCFSVLVLPLSDFPSLSCPPLQILVAIPIIILWMFCEQVLLAFNQEPRIASLAGTFTRLVAPGLPGLFLTFCFSFCLVRNSFFCQAK
jgi:MATE family multidrug resistance protein